VLNPEKKYLTITHSGLDRKIVDLICRKGKYKIRQVIKATSRRAD
jgi:hypothetical protein